MVLDLNLSNLGIGQHDAAMIGFWGTVAGCWGGILLGAMADMVPLPVKQRTGCLKLFIIALYTGALGSFAGLRIAPAPTYGANQFRARH